MTSSNGAMTAVVTPLRRAPGGSFALPKSTSSASIGRLRTALSSTTSRVEPSQATLQSLDTFAPAKVTLPAGPLNAQYGFFAKTVMASRLRHIYALAWTGTTCMLWFASLSLTSPTIAMSPTVLFCVWLTCVPIVVLRKSQPEFELTPAAWSPRALLSSAKRLSTYLVCLAYAASSAALTIALLTRLNRSDQSFALFTSWPERYERAQLNERCMYLVCQALFIAIVSGFRSAHLHEGAFEFERRMQKIPSRIVSRLRARVPLALRLAISQTVVYSVCHLTLRKPFLKLLIFRIPGGRHLRPWLHAFMRQNAVWSPSLIVRSLLAACLLHLAWALVHSLTDVYFSQTMAVSQFSPVPSRCIISGLVEANPHLKRLAYHELAHLVEISPPRRKQLFEDVASPPAFATLTRECLKLLGHTHQQAKVLQRASPAGSVAAATPGEGSLAKPSKAPIALAKLPIQNTNVFQPVKPLFYERLIGSDAPLEGQATQDKLVSKASTAFAQASQHASLKLPSMPLPGVRNLRNVDISLCAVHILSSMLVVSLDEDRYGTASRELPRTLEAFVLLCESLQAMLASKRPPANARAIQELANALHLAISDVLSAFKPYLSEFRFPTHIATKLQVDLH
ncbi:uncharacterized protein L969DRAFT_54550 [Mixia osmundae IAM 14324]|uniref:Nucleoporin NDC1 n=1 Tax=Mixia osmundae (strain CBS 9802 / IAM 14324 / JCM 22182 / KY 12970) TaxID=764103 RepID=G7E1H7_MIXOS|nr:uncharacterized protein L969DRAFT_54550 [Mixia osmundae IAM 14324]KEI36641.1 hypothetical protein L969DRAFT_54550 [Mixia osmundae IAM 14324]GAA96687.1 hypothetical protein E5Q_03358 [Mixia osmundae IAM 14324]